MIKWIIGAATFDNSVTGIDETAKAAMAIAGTQRFIGHMKYPRHLDF